MVFHERFTDELWFFEVVDDKISTQSVGFHARTIGVDGGLGVVVARSVDEYGEAGRCLYRGLHDYLCRHAKAREECQRNGKDSPFTVGHVSLDVE